MITNKNRIASVDPKMAFWRKRFHCSFWKSAVLTFGVGFKRGCGAKEFSVAKKRIIRLMRDQELEVIQKGAFRATSTGSDYCDLHYIALHCKRTGLNPYYEPSWGSKRGRYRFPECSLY